MNACGTRQKYILCHSKRGNLRGTVHAAEMHQAVIASLQDVQANTMCLYYRTPWANATRLPWQQASHEASARDMMLLTCCKHIQDGRQKHCVWDVKVGCTPEGAQMRLGGCICRAAPCGMHMSTCTLNHMLGMIGAERDI